MDKIRNIGGGMPLKLDDFDLVHNSFSMGFKSLINGLSGGEACLLYGLKITNVGGTVSVSEGYYFDGEEIFYCPADSFTWVEDYNVWLREAITTTEERTFHDTTDKDCWEYRRMYLDYQVIPPEAAVNLSLVKSLTTLINEQLTFPETVSGPCTGTKYEEMRKGLKFILFSPVLNGKLYYISRIMKGVGAGADKTYMVEIKVTSSLASPGVVHGIYEDTFTYGLTGYHFVPISFPEGMVSGGITGSLVIDWDEFTYGQTYTCANWEEGALSHITTPGESSTGGGAGITFPVLTEETTVYGGDSLLLVNMADPDDAVNLGNPGEIVGDVNLKNISATDLPVRHGEKPVDGYDYIILKQNNAVKIVTDGTNFYVKSGQYDAPPA